MQTIGMLLGIPESEQDSHRKDTDKALRAKPGEQLKPTENFADGASFAEYIDWRAEHPSDDLMTDLLNAELEDEDGTTRRLTREEVLTYTSLLAAAGAETTGRLISWSGKVLAEHPDQRRELADNPALSPRPSRSYCAWRGPRSSSPVTSPKTPSSTARSSRRARSCCSCSARPITTTGDSPTATASTSTARSPPRVLRLRGALLPGSGVGPPGGSHRARGGPQALPRLGDRHRERPDGVLAGGAGLGFTARVHP